MGKQHWFEHIFMDREWRNVKLYFQGSSDVLAIDLYINRKSMASMSELRVHHCEIFGYILGCCFWRGSGRRRWGRRLLTLIPVRDCDRCKLKVFSLWIQWFEMISQSRGGMPTALIKFFLYSHEKSCGSCCLESRRSRRRECRGCRQMAR